MKFQPRPLPDCARLELVHAPLPRVRPEGAVDLTFDFHATRLTARALFDLCDTWEYTCEVDGLIDGGSRLHLLGVCDTPELRGRLAATARHYGTTLTEVTTPDGCVRAARESTG